MLCCPAERGLWRGSGDLTALSPSINRPVVSCLISAGQRTTRRPSHLEVRTKCTEKRSRPHALLLRVPAECACEVQRSYKLETNKRALALLLHSIRVSAEEPRQEVVRAAALGLCRPLSRGPPHSTDHHIQLVSPASCKP